MAPRSPTGTVAHLLKGIDFPCDREGVVDYARRNNATQKALAALESIPEQRYASMAEVFTGLRLARLQREAEQPQPAEPPPEPPEYQEEMSNPPPQSLCSPVGCEEVLAPWMWPAQFTCAWIETMNRLLASMWWQGR
jgi:hypothetical protein